MEIMVAVGILGGLSLVIGRLSSNQQKSIIHMESKTEEHNLYNEIKIVLLRKAACEHTFVGQTLNSEILSIKNHNGVNRFSKNDIYNKTLLIKEMRIQPDPDGISNGSSNAIFNVQVERVRKAPGGPISSPSMDMRIKVVTDAVNSITSCFEDMDDHFVNITGDTMAGDLNLPGLSATTEVCIAGNCRTNFGPQTCVAGSVVTSVNTDGTVVCAPPQYPVISCAPGTLVRSIDASGVPTCVTPSFNDITAKPGNVACGSGQAVSAVNCSTGTVSCITLPVPPSCPSGGSGSGSGSSSGSGTVEVDPGTAALEDLIDECASCPTSCSGSSAFVPSSGSCPSGFAKNSTNTCVSLCSTSAYIPSSGACATGFAKNSSNTCVNLCKTSAYIPSSGACASTFDKNSGNTCIYLCTTSAYIPSSGACGTGFDKNSSSTCVNLITETSYIPSSGSCASGFAKNSSNACINLFLSSAYIPSSGACATGYDKNSSNTCVNLTKTSSYIPSSGACASGFAKNSSSTCIKL
jgi:hypothetical protein